MNILLNPDVAYLLLVAGTMLTLLAIVTPGTGMLEVGAAFCLLLAGYAIYNLPFNWWALVILFVSLLPFLLALRVPRREVFLALAIVGLVIGSVFFFTEGGKPSVNPILALIVSSLCAGYLWISIRKVIQISRARPMHDLSVLIGMVGEAKTQVSTEGSVQVAGELWSARSDKMVTSGSPVRVLSREGFVLVVENLN
jgi:membrane-bound serine protease (ClpP class)